MLKEHQSDFLEAVEADLGKPPLETNNVELAPIFKACLHTIEKLEEWTAPHKPAVEDWKSTWDTTVYRVPKGAALIIG